MHLRSSRRWLVQSFVRTLQVCAAICAITSIAAPPGGRGGTGKVVVSSQPPGASFYLDGHMGGKTPGAVEDLGPGKYFLRVELEGYRPAELVIDLASGQTFETGPLRLASKDSPLPEPPPAPVARATPPPVSRPATPAPAPPAPATPAPVRTTPLPATPAPAPAPAPLAAGGEEETIRGLVDAHLKSISDGNVTAYLKLCAPKVDLYDEGMQGQDSIRKSREKLKARWPVYEISNVRDLTVRVTDKPDVWRASVAYNWNVSNPSTGKKANGTANDSLDFKKTGNEWLIVRMRQNVERKTKAQ